MVPVSYRLALSRKQFLAGIGILLVLSIGLLVPLFLINNQIDTRTSAQEAQAVLADSREEYLNGPSFRIQQGTKIYVDQNEPLPIQKAVLDLQRDIEKVLGVRPQIITSIEALNGASAIVVSYNAPGTEAFRDGTLSGEEAHQFSVREVDGVTYAVLQGSDIRGTVYAVYTFSDKVVGVPPLWYWSEWQPEQKTEIVIAENSGLRITSPRVKYRTFFPNNQDLFLGWSSNGDKHEILFETMLRLKFNTYYVGADLGQFSESVYTTKTKPASDRGLIITTNALSTFGSWDKYWTEKRGMATPPVLSLGNSNLFEEYWRYSLQYAKDKNLDVLWQLGFRGRGDESFWQAMSDAPSGEAQRGSEIESQTQRQIGLVRNVMGQGNSRMAFLLWNELTTLADSGYLDMPQDTGVVWLFGNDIRDHFPSKSSLTYSVPTSQPFGFYMNLQFYSTGAHLAEAEGPWKVAENLTRIAGRKPGERIDMVMFNIGNIREFLVTTHVASEMMWSLNSYAVDNGLQKIFARYVSDPLAQSLVTSYRDFLNAYWQQKPSDISGFERQYLFHDLRIKEAITVQLKNIRARTRNLNPFNNDRLRIDYAYNGAASQVGAVMLGSQKAYTTLATVTGTINGYESEIPSANRNFYYDTLGVPAEFLHRAYKTLYLVTRSHFKVQSSLSESVCYLKDAQTEAYKLQESLSRAKHGTFTTWYAEESLFGVEALINDINATLQTLPQQTCATATPTSSVSSPTPTRTPTPSPTRAPSPTPTRTPTPTVSQATIQLQTAYPGISGLKESNVKDGKRTVFRAMRTMKLKQLGCYGCTAGSTLKLWHSSSSFAFRTQLYTGSISTVESSWGYVNTDIQLTGGHYYIFEFTPATTPVYYGSTIQQYSYLQFLRYATVGAPSWKTGSWQIRLGY